VGATAATEQAVDVGGRWRRFSVCVSRARERERERARELGRGCKWNRGDGRAGRGVQKGRWGSVVARERADVGASTVGRSWARG
jgi:hypothetical protein